MGKMAENCGGRSGSRSPDLLGVNGRDIRQFRHLAKATRGRFANIDPLSSGSVSQSGTERTELDADDLKMMAALDFECAPSAYPSPPKGHIVYFVGATDGPIKIGWTQQPIKARLVCIQNGSPLKLHVLATMAARREKEKLYHKLFAPIRLHGEWFERHPLLLREIDWINGVAGANPVAQRFAQTIPESSLW